MDSSSGNSTPLVRGENYLGQNLVFIVGCPRSGTSWLQQLLSSHPKVHTGQESYVFPHYIHPIFSRWKREMAHVGDATRREGLSAYFTNEEFEKVLKDYFLLLVRPMLQNVRAGELFLEKTPDNSLHMDEIYALLPKARFIHIIRDGRDVVVSLLASTKTWGKEAWGNLSARSAARMWMKYLAQVNAAKRLIPREQLYEVKYEDLRVSTLEKLNEMREFLGLEWTEQEMRKVVMSNSFGTPFKDRTQIPLGGELALQTRKSGGKPARSDRSSSWKEDLSILQKLSVWLVARRTLSEYGYQW